RRGWSAGAISSARSGATPCPTPIPCVRTCTTCGVSSTNPSHVLCYTPSIRLAIVWRTSNRKWLRRPSPRNKDTAKGNEQQGDERHHISRGCFQAAHRMGVRAAVRGVGDRLRDGHLQRGTM